MLLVSPNKLHVPHTRPLIMFAKNALQKYTYDLSSGVSFYFKFYIFVIQLVYSRYNTGKISYHALIKWMKFVRTMFFKSGIKLLMVTQCWLSIWLKTASAQRNLWNGYSLKMWRIACTNTLYYSSFYHSTFVSQFL